MTDKILIDRAVVEQALKALERADRIAGYKNNWSETVALRAAMEQPQVEQEPDWQDLYRKEKRRTEMWIAKYEKDIGKLELAVPVVVQPQIEQEPVAWIERWYGSGPERGWWIVCGRDHIAHLGPAEMSGEAASKIVSAHNTSPPAQRQPLTDEQIEEATGSRRDTASWLIVEGIARAVEAAHGIGGEK